MTTYTLGRDCEIYKDGNRLSISEAIRERIIQLEEAVADVGPGNAEAALEEES